MVSTRNAFFEAFWPKMAVVDGVVTVVILINL